jgi:hypothetical protein
MRLLKPQDILVLLRMALSSSREETFNQLNLSHELGMVPSEISRLLQTCYQVKLVNDDNKRVNRTNLIEFLVHGLKYVFPAKLGPPTIGVPTAWGVKGLFPSISLGHQPVWPHISGETSGYSVEPLYKSIPELVVTSKINKQLYFALAAVDTIRIGEGRERQLAITYLMKALNDYQR